LLKEVLKGEGFHRVLSNFIDLNLDFTKCVAQNGDKSKVFAWTTAGPGHIRQSLNTTREAEFENWMPKYKEAIRDMKIEIDSLVKNNSIIIFMSDHGPFLVDVPALPKNYDFNKTDYLKFRDLFGAFMAVRWPSREKAEKYDNDFNTTQDLFPIIFAYLFDSEIPLRYKMKNTELRLGPHKFDKGVFYKDFYKDM
jgi:arylsulfatase A-like enzyme